MACSIPFLFFFGLGNQLLLCMFIFLLMYVKIQSGRTVKVGVYNAL
jgi:hypothetical protein